jgi:hypothetical protein
MLRYILVILVVLNILCGLALWMQTEAELKVTSAAPVKVASSTTRAAAALPEPTSAPTLVDPAPASPPALAPVATAAVTEPAPTTEPTLVDPAPASPPMAAVRAALPATPPVERRAAVQPPSDGCEWVRTPCQNHHGAIRCDGGKPRGAACAQSKGNLEAIQDEGVPRHGRGHL